MSDGGNPISLIMNKTKVRAGKPAGPHPHGPASPASETTKRLRHKHKTLHTKPSFIPFPFGFLSAFAGEMLIKNPSYAKAASHYYQSLFGSLSIQLAVWSCSSSAIMGFWQAPWQASSVLSLSWHSCFRSWFHWLVFALFAFRSSSA